MTSEITTETTTTSHRQWERWYDQDHVPEVGQRLKHIDPMVSRSVGDGEGYAEYYPDCGRQVAVVIQRGAHWSDGAHSGYWLLVEFPGLAALGSQPE